MDDMKKLDVKAPVEIGDIEDLKSKAYDRIMGDPFIRGYLKESGLPLSFVNDNLGLFLRMEEENRPCRNCKSFKNCKKEQNTKGYQAYVDPFESITYKPCEYYKEFLNIANRYVYRDFSDEDVFIDLSDINTVDPQTKELAGKLAKSIKTNKSLYIYSQDSIEIINKLLKWIVNSTLKTEHNAAYINANTLVDKVETYNRFDKDKFYSFDKMSKEVDILVIEGLGSERATDFFKYSYLMDLITYREQHKLLTFVSSYFSLKELKETYGGYNLRFKTDLLIKKINEYLDETPFNTLLK